MVRQFLLALVCATAFGTQCMGQEPGTARPAAGHSFLKKFVGEWEALMGPEADDPNAKPNCSISGRMLGGLWVVVSYEGDMGGAPLHALQTIGFDEKSGKYIGTWVDSMMNHMWKYEGTVNEEGTTIALEADGPDMMGGTDRMVRYRDVYEFKSPDLIESSSQVWQDDKWFTFMTSQIRRKK